MVYIVEQLILQTIYVLNKEILQFLGQKSRAVSNWEQVMMARVQKVKFPNYWNLAQYIEQLRILNLKNFFDDIISFFGQWKSLIFIHGTWELINQLSLWKKSKSTFGEIVDINETPNNAFEFLKLHSYRPNFARFEAWSFILILETLHKPSD